MKLVITGGHHTSAMPVIHELKKSHPEVEIFWIGHKHSLKGNKNETLEFIEISKENIPFYELMAGKVYRTANIGMLLKIPFGFIQAFCLLLNTKPNVILSFGGYLAAPVVFAGWILGIPSVTHEQTVVLGYANKFISYFAKKILISWESSRKYFKSDKTILTGIPLRESILLQKTNKYEFENNLPIIFIICGKNGSHKINELVLANLKDLLLFTNIVHQTGSHSIYNDVEVLKNEYNMIRNEIKGKYYAKEYVLEDEIGEIYSKSDLVVSRAGAHSVYELAVLKKPSILIPIPWVSHDEQLKNALLLKSFGLAVIIEEKDLTYEELKKHIQLVLFNLNDIKKNSAQFDYIKDSASLIVKAVIEVANEKKTSL